MTRAFDQPLNLGVMICTRVFEGGSLLRVSRDDEGDWQFLCDADHSLEGACPPKLVCLSEVVQRNPGIVELSDLCIAWSASRRAPGAPWTRHDDTETTIHDNVREYGWHACLIEEDVAGPGFIYSIGIFKTFKKPEIIVFGIPTKVGHTLITTAADRFKEGGTLPLGVPVDEFLTGYPVVFKEVHSSQYREYFGYGLWYYDGPKFPALQLFWPDKEGKFPWDAGFAQKFRTMQPDLSQPR